MVDGMISKDKAKCYIYTRVSTALQVDGYSLDAQRETDHTRQICSCAHIYACAKLPLGEEMLLAYLLFVKNHRNLR